MALADVSFTVGPGVTGLLGPQRRRQVDRPEALRRVHVSPAPGRSGCSGTDLAASPDAYRRIGIAHDRDALWPFLTARGDGRPLRAAARGRATPTPPPTGRSARWAWRTPPTASCAGFSHGMRQRVKLAQALAHDPELLLLDEPLNGLDPAQRRGVVELIRRLGEEGRTVVVSSHVLHEVERMAPAGAGAGERPPGGERRHPAIRELIADRPRASAWRPATEGRALGPRAGGARAWSSRCASTTGRCWSSRATSSASAARCPASPATSGARLRRVEPVGDDLESVYAYLHERARGVGR